MFPASPVMLTIGDRRGAKWERRSGKVDVVEGGGMSRL